MIPIDIKIDIECKKRGWIFVSSEMIGKKRRVYFTCDKGHHHSMFWGKIKIGQGCGKCQTSSKKTVQDVEEILKKRKFELLVKTYKNNRSPLKLKCPNDHVYYSTLDNFQRTKFGGCEECNPLVIDPAQVRQAFEKESYTLKSPYINAHAKINLICPYGTDCSISWNHWYSSNVRCQCTNCKK